MAEPTILVTGATDGIGRQTALELARQGARVLLHGRDPAKGRAVLDDLRRRARNDRLAYYNADLSALANVLDLARQVQRDHDHLDVLINNAGVFMRQRVLSADGYEMTFAVNHLAPVLLTHQLLPLLRRSAPARIVMVSSTTHHGARLDFDNLQGEKGYDGYQAYGLSKLANILFTYALAERLDASGVVVNALHPGVIETNLMRAGWGSGGSSSLAQGAATSVYLATAPEAATVTGQYFTSQRPARSSDVTHDRAVRERFWTVTNDLITAALGSDEWRGVD